MNELSEQEKDFVRRVFVDEESVLAKSSDKIRAFLLEYPDILLEHSSDSKPDCFDFPLHLLCEDLVIPDGRPVRIRQIRQLMEMDSSCLLKPSHRHNLPLHCTLVSLFIQFERTCVDTAWMELLKSMIQAQPAALTVQNYDSDTALHLACRGRLIGTLPIVRLLFEANSEAAMVRDDDGQLPLHFACMNMLPEEVVKFLIQECPASILVPDAVGNLPLHSACSSRTGLIFDNIQLLVESYPIALTHKNNRKQTPLHIACGRTNSVDVIEFLVRKNRDVLCWQDQNGCLPLHYICGIYFVKDMFALMRLHMPLLPQLIQVKNKQGKTPGQDDGRWFRNFSKQAIGRLQEEHAVRETLKWMNAAARTLQSCEDNISGARFVIEWINKHNADCHEELALIENKLTELVDTYSQKDIRRFHFEGGERPFE
jgi:ankyrin repeat protein